MCSCLRDGATILHADLDAFYASVEQRDDPRLRGRPVIVGGGVVLAASYEAKAYGVRTAMGGGQARAAVPEAVVVAPRFSAYVEASRAVFAVFDDTTPMVEGLSIDEAFLDVGGLRRIAGPPAEIAERLRGAVRDRVGLAITVGVARTKFLAKVASGVAKPDGLLVVAARRRAGLPPSPGRGTALGRRAGHRRQAAGPGDRDGRRGGGLAGGGAGVDARARRRAATSTPWPTTGIPARCRSAGAGGRSVPSTPWAGRPGPSRRPPRSTPSSSAWSTGSPAGCGPPAGSAAPSCCGCASTTSPGSTRSHTLPRATDRTDADPRGRPAISWPAPGRSSGPGA